MKPIEIQFVFKKVEAVSTASFWLYVLKKYLNRKDWLIWIANWPSH